MGKRLRNLSKKKDLMKPIIYWVYLTESDNADHKLFIFTRKNRKMK